MHTDYEDSVLELVLPGGKELTPFNLFLHVWLVIKGRWPEAEPIIMEDPNYAYLYAKDVIKGRWPEAEPTIKEYPQWACWYALNVIKGRWPEAEPTIRKNLDTWKVYRKHFGISE